MCQGRRNNAPCEASAGDPALGRAVLPQHPAGAALRDAEPATDMVDAPEAARGG